MSLIMRKPAFCICENKDADQRLCFRYTDSTISLLSRSAISILQLSFVAVQPGLCRTWSETPKTGFLLTGLTYICILGLDSFRTRLTISALHKPMPLVLKECFYVHTFFKDVLKLFYLLF